MATKTRQPKLSTQVVTERPKLRPTMVRVELRRELVARPAVSSGLVARAEIARRLTKVDIVNFAQKAGKPLDGGEIETHVELSAGVPWVVGRGWLNAFFLRAWASQTVMAFVPNDPGQEEDALEIVLDGLTQGDSYLAQIRVGGLSFDPQLPGTFHIGVSDTAHADILQSGLSQTLSVFLPSVQGPMSLILVKTKGIGAWYFDDVLVSHLGKL